MKSAIARQITPKFKISTQSTHTRPNSTFNWGACFTDRNSNKLSISWIYTLKCPFGSLTNTFKSLLFVYDSAKLVLIGCQAVSSVVKISIKISKNVLILNGRLLFQWFSRVDICFREENETDSVVLDTLFPFFSGCLSFQLNSTLSSWILSILSDFNNFSCQIMALNSGTNWNEKLDTRHILFCVFKSCRENEKKIISTVFHLFSHF